MNAFPELLPAEVIKRAWKLEVSQLCDGMKKLNIYRSGCMDSKINPVDPTSRMVGTAVTVETFNGDNYPIHLATYTVPDEGYIMVIDGKKFEGAAYLGDKIVAACKAMGYKGIVIDGLTRDRSGCIALQFPVFSRGLMPAGPIKKNQGKINETIICGDIPVSPGDLVCGDEDGVCVVPKKYIYKVLDEAENKQKYENERELIIKDYMEKKATGKKLPQLSPQWVIDMIKR